MSKPQHSGFKKPQSDDDFPIQHLEARIERTKLDISLHQKDVVAMRATRQKYEIKYPKIFHSYDDEIAHSEKAVRDLEKELEYEEAELAQELAKEKKP